MRSGRRIGTHFDARRTRFSTSRNTRSSAVPRGSPRANRRLKRDAMSDANGSPPRAMEEEDDDRRPQRSPREGSPERKVRERSARRERRRTDAPRGRPEPLDAVGGAEFGDAARDRGMDIMAGCMMGSSLAMAPALLFAQHARITDLDAPLLLAEDRATPIDYDADGIHPPKAELWG